MQQVSDPTTITAGSRLGIQTSDIPTAGRGLFTLNRIREGRTIGEYFGDDIIPDHDYGQINDLIASYSMGNHDDSYIYCAFSIARNVMLCMCGYINDPLDDSKCNVRPVWRGPRCRIVATRDIEPLEELYMAYGQASWMRDIWSSEIIRRAWDNYGVRRTEHLWRELYYSRLAMEAEERSDSIEDVSDIEDSEDEGGGEGVVSRVPTADRLLWDQLDFSKPYFG